MLIFACACCVCCLQLTDAGQRWLAIGLIIRRHRQKSDSGIYLSIIESLRSKIDSFHGSLPLHHPPPSVLCWDSRANGGHVGYGWRLAGCLAIVELPAPVRSCAPWASFNSIPTLALQKKSGRYVLKTTIQRKLVVWPPSANSFPFQR